VAGWAQGIGPVRALLENIAAVAAELTDEAGTISPSKASAQEPG
jgi:hypothetical protein